MPQLARWHHQYWRHAGRETSLQQRLEKLADHLSQALLPTTWVAFRDGNLVGSISLVSYSMATEARSAWVANLFVCREQRRQGIGSALLQHVIASGRDLGFDWLYLFTPDHKDFYAKRCWRWHRRLRLQGQWVDVLDFSLCHSPGKQFRCN